MDKIFRGEKILVTGGTGSFGQELVRYILKFDPKVIRIFSNDETQQFEMKNSLKGFENLRFLIGDVREKDRLKQAMHNIDIVYHLAALKHVESCEYNPFEAMRTNVIGTQNLIEVALDEGAKKVIFTSTDKAVNPSSTMGASKLLAERLIIAANFYKGDRKTIFSSVRFGNILGSRGSVIPLFEAQILKGEPITVTNKNMTRFALLIEEALKLVLKATRLAKGGEVFVFKMPVIRLIDLAEVIIERAIAKGGKLGRKEMKFIGLLPGEKPYEELMTEEESNRALEVNDMYIITPAFRFRNIEYIYSGERIKRAEVKAYLSKGQEFLSKKAINSLLDKI